MSSRDHIVHFSSKHDSSTEYRTLPVLLKNVQSIFVDKLEAKLVEMLDTADDRLFDMSETSYNNAQFDAMRLLRVKREGLVNRFKQEIVNNFKQTLGKLDSGQFQQDNIENLSFENIALVKDDDLEEDIATDTMVNKARTANQDALENIRARIDTIVADKSIEEHNNPFEPVYVCDAFRNATQTLDLDIASLLIIYKLFDRSVISQLDTVFSSVNQYFVDKGILPQLRSKVTIKKSPSASQKAPVSQSNESIIDSLPINESNELSNQGGAATQTSLDTNQANVLSVIQQLLAGQRQTQPNQFDSEIPMMETAEGGQGATVSQETGQIATQNLLQALSSIQLQQNAPIDINVKPQVADIRMTLGQQLPQVKSAGGSGQSALGQFNEDMIDIVSMLFDFILEDDNLQPELKSVIGRLQIPMLKVGLVDKSFFSERRHPARVLLNELAHAGLSWDKRDPSAAPMFDKICSTAESIIQNFNEDTSIFNGLLSEFLDFKQQHQQRANIFEKRTKEAEEGKAKTESARSEVNKKLSIICRAVQVPEVVKLLLKSVWSHAMLLERLKDNKDGWNRRVKVAKLLVWSVQPIKTADRLEKLITRVPILVKSLREGMDLISFSTIESTNLLDQLENAHREVIEKGRKTINQLSEEDILRLPAIDLDLNDITQAASHQESTEVKEPITEASIILEEPIVIEEIGFTKVETGEVYQQSQVEPVNVDSHTVQTVEQLRAGSWVELEIDGEFKRSKLAARIASSGKYIFVNRSGMKMAEFFTNELCQSLQLGKMKILDDEALFDRALESVISNLRSMKSQD